MVADDALRVSAYGIGDNGIGGQTTDGPAAGVYECRKISTVAAAGVMLVVGSVRGSRTDCDDERVMQLLRIGPGECVRLLGQRVDVVICCLERDLGADDARAVCAGEECREGSCTLEVLAFGAEIAKGKRPEFCAWNVVRALPQMSYLVANRREDAHPVAACRKRKGNRLMSVDRSMRHIDSFATGGAARNHCPYLLSKVETTGIEAG